MEIYLIRHGIAAEAIEYAEDKDRPLIERGRTKTEKVAERLVQLEIKFDLLLTSPFLRAKQTADILKKAGLANKITELEHLSPEGNLSDWLQELPETRETIALVGHQPNLGNWAEQLVWGTVGEKLMLKKAGIIGVQIPSLSEEPSGKGELFLLVSPKWMLA